MTVLLATCSQWPTGEPGAAALDAALARRGLDARWVCWDDASVAWADADVVAVRSTWDYVDRPADFLDWARRVEASTPLLNGADVFAWNVRVDLLRHEGAWCVSELEAIEPGLYLDLLPGNAEPFADLVAARLG